MHHTYANHHQWRSWSWNSGYEYLVESTILSLGTHGELLHPIESGARPDGSDSDFPQKGREAMTLSHGLADDFRYRRPQTTNLHLSEVSSRPLHLQAYFFNGLGSWSPIQFNGG